MKVALIEIDRADRARLLRGDLGNRNAAPGWPHDDSVPGMAFLDSGGTTFLILDEEGRVAGECGTKTPPSRLGVVEIGYGLAAPSRGKGLGTAAIALLIQRLSSSPAVRVIEAEVHLGNEPSSRLLLRLGFAETGRPIDGFQRYRLRVAPSAVVEAR